VVVGVDDYDDEDSYEDHDNDPRALHYAIERLRLSDIADFTLSFTAWPLRWEVFRGSLFKGFVLQQDIVAFISNIHRRLSDVRLYNQGWSDWTYSYNEDPRTLAGLTIDWKAWKAHYPPDADDIQRATVEAALLRPVAPQTGHFAAFRRRWLGALVRRYRGTRTKVIFVRLARGPVVRPPSLVRKRSASIREFASLPNVRLIDEHAFESLERPELFKDALHLNRDGCARFSAMLVEQVGQALKQ
jgi:hypothetical protein